MTPKYRSDIDGLRAIAVLSVLFFHSGISIFSGGYVGVDIFFVISGYLITSIIVREIANDDFSISRFYERRFRRILPALFVVVVVSLSAGSFLLMPNGVIDLGKSAIATALFSSNMLFYIESGYFDIAAEMKPLLHTWSLAIEEQYYIFFPLLLILIAKTDARHYLRWLVILSVLSFVTCIVLTDIMPSAAFYWIPTRAWELFIGSILALNVIHKPYNRLVREIYSVLGIVMISYSIFQFSTETSFPGMAAVLPTVGAALIILSGTGGPSFVSNVLSFRPMVFIGLISYSLYLWHWPIIVYTKIYAIKEPTLSVMVVMFTLIFILSVLSWKYVESPFRKKMFLEKKSSVLGASAIVSMITIIIGLSFVVNDGYPHRLANDDVLTADVNDEKWHYWGACQKVVDRIKNNKGLCDIGAETKKNSFIVWGDSHARALASGVDLSAKKHGLNGNLATKAGCAPLLSIERENRRTCDEFNQAVLEFISVTPDIDTVILAARWALSTKGTRYKKESGGPVKLVDLESQNLELSNVQLFEIGLARTIEKLRELGKKVVLVNPLPEIGYDVPSAYLITTITGREINEIIAPSEKEYRSRTEEVTAIFREMKDRMSVDIVTPEFYLLNNSYYRVTMDDIPLYRDQNHLSTFGSEYISEAFDKVFHDAAIRENTSAPKPNSF